MCRDYGESTAGLARVRAAEHPSFSGILRAGQTLTSSPGVWLAAGGFGTDRLTYQWLRDGRDIPGAVGETYTITESDDGRSLALRVRASAPGVNDGVETTLPSPAVSGANTAEYTARPGITGETPAVSGWPRVGFTLEVRGLGTWSPGLMSVRPQWQADGEDIVGATGNEYTIQTADLGRTITLKVTGTSAGVPSVSMSSTGTAVTPGYIAPPDEMWLTGGDKVGDTLSVVQGSAHWSADGEPVNLSYEWRRDNQPIAGATAATYTATAADSGHRIHANVTATAPGHSPNTQTTLYTEITGGVTDGNGGSTPVPAPEPLPIPEAPVPETPVPDAAPPASTQPSPALQAPAARPQTRTTRAQVVAAQNDGPAKAYVRGGQDSGAARPQAKEPVRAAGSGAAAPAGQADGPAAAPAGQLAAAPASPPPSPSSAPSSEPAAAPAQAAAAAAFNPLPLFFTVAGVLIAAGLIWVIRPLRSSVARAVGRKTP